MENLVAAELHQLEREGRLLPGDVVDRARPPDSPLHQFFEWDESEAAEQYRRIQAARLIRSVKLEIKTTTITLAVPAYVRDPSLGTRPTEYLSFARVQSDEEKQRALLIDEMKRVGYAMKRAKTLATAFGLSDRIVAIDELAASIIGQISNPGRDPGDLADQPPEGEA
jgi:hypothetical protein